MFSLFWKYTQTLSTSSHHHHYYTLIKTGIHRQNNDTTPNDIHTLIPGTYENVALHGNSDFSDAIKSADFEIEDYLYCLGEIN